MKIELKNIRFSQKLSHETNAFSGDIYIDGEKCATAINHGKGGATTISAFTPELREKMKQAEAYCKAMPPQVFDWGTVPMNLEFYIDTLLDNYLNNKSNNRFEEKMKKAMANKIVLVSEDGNSYVTFPLHRPERTIESYFKSEFEKEHLINWIRGIYKQAVNKKYASFKVANTNIPANMIAKAMASMKLAK